MATPPTRVSYNTPSTGNYSSTATSRTTTAFDVTAGDLIVVLSSIENAGSQTAVTPSASGGSVTWTQQVRVPASSNVNTSGAWCWTGAVGATATGITVSLNRPSSDSTLWWGMSATVYRDHGGVGAVFSGTNGTGANSAPQVAATCSANSAVVCQINDWNASSGSRTWLTINGAAQTETVYFTSGAHHTVYGGYRADTGAAGSITQGLSAPTNQRWVLAGVEILGTTSGTTHALASTGTGTSTGSLNVNLVQATSSTGTGTSTGSVNLLLAPGALSATGTGASTGSANLNATLALSATGTGQSAGSAALTIVGGATTHDLSATGSGSSTGSLAVNLQLACSSTGTGASTGSLAVVERLAISATGTGQTAGAVGVNLRQAIQSTGTGASTGSVAVTLVGAATTRQLAATGTTQTSGSIAVTVVEPTFFFSPPIHEEPFRLDRDHPAKPLSYYRLTYALSVVKLNGVWTPMRSPMPEVLEGLVDGVDYFRGGYEYVIDRATAQELVAAGYTAPQI